MTDQQLILAMLGSILQYQVGQCNAITGAGRCGSGWNVHCSNCSQALGLLKVAAERIKKAP